jgi:outer membrane lipoprotein-sorting protein
MHWNNTQEGDQLMHKSRAVVGFMAIALILALLIPLVGCGGGGTSATPTPTITTTPSSTVPSCTVSSPAGTVQVQKKGSTSWTNAAAGTKLEVGDSLKTGSNGSAVLLFFDGSSMEVKANSQILVKELSIASAGSTSVGLKELVGSTVNRVAKLVDSSSKYEVDTPAAAAVVRGTIFDLLVQQNGDTTVKAEQDSVSFTASGKTVTVNQGFQSSASVGGTPSTPITFTTPTSTSGETLGDIYGVGKNIGDVKFDQVMTTSGQTQPMTWHVYMKNAWLINSMKIRYEITGLDQTTVQTVELIDYSARTMYTYMPAQNIAYLTNFAQAPGNPTENSNQIKPTYLGTETLDSKLCDVYQYSFEGATAKVWVWKEKSFPIRMETTTSSGTSTLEYENIVFGTLSDSLFQLPAGVQIMQFPQST